MGWQPISTAPKDGTHILIFDEFGECSVAWWQVDSDGSIFGWTTDGGDRVTATHWMPLPEPPSAT